MVKTYAVQRGVFPSLPEGWMGKDLEELVQLLGRRPTADEYMATLGSGQQLARPVHSSRPPRSSHALLLPLFSPGHTAAMYSSPSLAPSLAALCVQRQHASMRPACAEVRGFE